jgi:hypothetical protein
MINESLSRVWELIFDSQFCKGRLTQYKCDFLKLNPENWILLQEKMRMMQKELI